MKMTLSLICSGLRAYFRGNWLACGLKARDVKAWGEAHRAEPQVMCPTNPTALQGRDKVRSTTVSKPAM